MPPQKDACCTSIQVENCIPVSSKTLQRILDALPIGTDTVALATDQVVCAVSLALYSRGKYHHKPFVVYAFPDSTDSNTEKTVSPSDATQLKKP